MTLALGLITVVLFMYILFIPLIRGEKPDVRAGPSAYIHLDAEHLPVVVPSLATVWCTLNSHSGMDAHKRLLSSCDAC